MANLYLELLDAAKRLPNAYEALRSPAKRFTDTSTGGSVTGWIVCQFSYKMNRDGNEWWSNDFNLLVDKAGQLWELLLSEEDLPYDGGRHSYVHLSPVSGETLRSWDVNGWDFAKMKRSIESMV